MRFAGFVIAMAALAQEAPVTRVTVPAGVPLRVALEKRVPIKRVGEPVRGRLVEPVYVFDRVVLPAGTVAEGRVSEVSGVPAGRRIRALLSGNLTPPRDVRAQFDTLVLNNRARLPLRTSPARGTAHIVRVAKPGKKMAGAKARLRRAGHTFTAPGRMNRLKSRLLAMLPYHRQAWPAGTLFTSALQQPLTGMPGQLEAHPQNPAAPGSGAREVAARLVTPITSAIAKRGAPVEAVVTRPLFSSDRTLLIPEGSRLLGDIVDAKPARHFHRNGKVLFVFRQVVLPSGAAQRVQGYLDNVQADFDSHLALDSEGAARASSPKTRFVFPGIAVAVAGLSIHQDYNAQGVPDQDIAGRAESGAVGLGLLGTVLAQTSRTLASSLAFTGAGFSVYSNFIARGEDVVLPANTPVTVSLRARGSGASPELPVKR